MRSPSIEPDRTVPSSETQEPHLRLLCVTMFVRDLDRSLGFYRDRLGFRVVVDATFAAERWIAVAPPDGTALVALVQPGPDVPEYALIGSSRHVVFATDDVTTKFDLWRSQGVHFHLEPFTPPWGGTFTTFEDLDGNSFALVGREEFIRELEVQRQVLLQKLEAERLAAQELEIAKQIQTRLLPTRRAELRTLDYAGACIQARQVGGDYYDFLELGAKRLGLVIADVSGKGIGAALLMANLQANLRSQCAVAGDQPRLLLRTVNQLFCESATPQPGEWAPTTYATLFFAEYDDQDCRLRYVNCGHLSGLVLRADDGVERLQSTATVLGLFSDWDCSIGERQLRSGDVLALYTDGVTESFDEAEREFGEDRLIAAMRRGRGLPARALLTSIIDEVRAFNRHEQHDDITLIVAKCRGA